MSLRFRDIAFPLLFGILTLRAAEQDEVRFKTRTYTPDRTAGHAVYRSEAYTESAAKRPIGKTTEPRDTRGFFGRLFRSRTAEAGASSRPATTRPTETEPYVPGSPIRVPTIQADVKAVPEKQPYVASEKKEADRPFTAQAPDRGKNPLLRPRQGIREPE
ncbi:MAG TPA: hypothetical protein P5125_07390 [Kiritimatiellia bacterium]|jgi:hypothetical protein|nr:hypothetical protein [Kiritimatiellia bacterium]HOR97878.1 hypothetical protein [Kiritimatiellia bacterium]HPC49403.1 hypothetical protein [Kiritimatiellia bacterium]HPK37283.1 hypothetical protein [Kiritimatiellia bacterium]HPW75673.1 hypothetical protein [Kiritimatiellia bacterium]